MTVNEVKQKKIKINKTLIFWSTVKSLRVWKFCILQATGVRLATLVQAVVGLVAALGIAFYYGWKLAFVVLGGVPLMAAAGN